MKGRRVGVGHRLTVFFFASFAVTVLFLAVSAQAGSGRLFVSADRQIALADMFFSKGEYDRAITAYETFLFFFPDDEKACHARFRTAASFFGKGDLEAALERFEAIYRDGACDRKSVEAGFWMARCYLDMGMGERALSVLDMVAEDTEDREVKDRVSFESGIVFLKSHGVLDDSLLARAKESFESVSGESRERFGVERILDEIETARHGEDGLLASMKSPTLAGALAVVPGAGYLYCGRPRDALVSFLFNGMMIAAAYEAFDEGNGALGAVISVVELGFYGGNIYGSVGAAHKYNRRKTAEFLDRLGRSARIGMTGAEDGHGVLFLFQKRF